MFKPNTKNELICLIDKTIANNGNTANLNFIDNSEITDMEFLFCDSPFVGDVSG